MSSDRPDEYPPAVADRWESVLEDARSTAAEFREDGWSALLLHTADVTPLTDEPFGLDVLVPGDEFADLLTAIEDATFDRTDVFRADDGDARFFVIAVAAEADRVAVVIPAFLALSEAPALRERADEAGRLYTHVRSLSGDRRVTFTHEDASLFF